MFARTFFLFSLFLGSTAFVAYWDHVRFRGNERTMYKHFLVQNRPQSRRHALRNQNAEQLRETVQKDFWIPQNFQRKHIRITGKRSLLTVGEKQKDFEVVEELEGLDCWFQEIHTLERQQIHHIVAKKGTFFYPSHEFLAQDIIMQIFIAPGNNLPEDFPPEQACFTGTALEGSFSLCKQSPTFSAKHLQASFLPTRGNP